MDYLRRYDIDSATARKDIRSFTEILYLFLDYPHKYYVFKYFEV